jgi:hypothetical protein
VEHGRNYRSEVNGVALFGEPDRSVAIERGGHLFRRGDRSRGCFVLARDS